MCPGLWEDTMRHHNSDASTLLYETWRDIMFVEVLLYPNGMLLPLRIVLLGKNI